MPVNHTSGPWTVADDGTIESKYCGRVGQLVGCSEADQKLVAAAPALYAALRLIVDQHDQNNATFVIGMWAGARAALNKATPKETA